MSDDIVKVDIGNGKLNVDVHCPGDPEGTRCRAKMALLKVFASRMGFQLDVEREDRPNRDPNNLEVSHVRKKQKN